MGRRLIGKRLVLFNVCLFIWALALGTGIYGFKMVIVIETTVIIKLYKVIGSYGKLVC